MGRRASRPCVHGASIGGGGGGGGGNASLAFEKGTLLRSLAINVEVCAHSLRVSGGVAGACLLSVTRRRLLPIPGSQVGARLLSFGRTVGHAAAAEVVQRPRGVAATHTPRSHPINTTAGAPACQHAGARGVSGVAGLLSSGGGSRRGPMPSPLPALDAFALDFARRTFGPSGVSVIGASSAAAAARLHQTLGRAGGAAGGAALLS
jgi:hypothetical protein